MTSWPRSNLGNEGTCGNNSRSCSSPLRGGRSLSIGMQGADFSSLSKNLAQRRRGAKRTSSIRVTLRLCVFARGHFPFPLGHFPVFQQAVRGYHLRSFRDHILGRLRRSSCENPAHRPRRSVGLGSPCHVTAAVPSRAGGSGAGRTRSRMGRALRSCGWWR
jgi:hypothetical protein